MRICHVTNMDPAKSFGGVASVVRNLAKGYDVKFYNASGLFGIVKAFWLAAKLIFQKYDLIHFHDSIPGYFYLKLGGKAKTLYTSHGHWSTFFKVLPPVNFLARLKMKALLHFQNYTTTNADITVAVSNTIKKVIENNSRPNKVVVIYNGVDTKIFRPLGLKRKYAIWVGKDPYRKRLDKTLDYVRRHKMKLIVVGLKEIPFDTSGVEVEFYNDLPHTKLAKLYNKAKILPFFSEQEGHPLVVLEAMACGCDILASRSTNIEVIPIKGKFYRVSGENARKITLKYDWEEIRKEYAKLYEELIMK